MSTITFNKGIYPLVKLRGAARLQGDKAALLKVCGGCL
jgi:hypothetical protein